MNSVVRKHPVIFGVCIILACVLCVGGLAFALDIITPEDVKNIGRNDKNLITTEDIVLENINNTAGEVVTVDGGKVTIASNTTPAEGEQGDVAIYTFAKVTLPAGIYDFAANGAVNAKGVTLQVEFDGTTVDSNYADAGEEAGTFTLAAETEVVVKITVRPGNYTGLNKVTLKPVIVKDGESTRF